MIVGVLGQTADMSVGRTRLIALRIRNRAKTGVILIPLVFMALNTAARAIVDGEHPPLSCPESPLCASVRVDDAGGGTVLDCYCLAPEAGILRHFRLVLELRRAHFVGVVRGPDAEVDDYKGKPVSGGGRTAALTGPIVDVPVSLRSARSLQASPDGRVLHLTLASGVVLSLARDPGSGDLRQSSQP